MALTTSNLQIHYDFSNSSCYPGSGTTVTNLGSGGSTYNGTILGSTVAYDSAFGGILDFSGTSGRISVPHNTAVTGVASNAVNRTIQLWVKLDTLKTGTVKNGLVGKLGSGAGFDGYIFFTDSSGKIGMTLNAATESTPLTTTSQVTTNEWALLTITFNTSNTANSVKIYDNDTLTTISPTNYAGTIFSSAETLAMFIGQGYRGSGTAFSDPLDGQIGAFYMYDRQLTAQEVIDNYEATKARFIATDVTITETPATATNANIPEPVISTTIGATIASDPLTATAEISYLAVSGEVNYLDLYRQATAILTEPTIVITSNDHTEIVTSISVSALMVNPFSVIAEINISINAGDFGIVTADIGTHDSIAGSSISYPADEATASAEMIEPFRFGSDDNVEFPAPMTASALMANGVGSVTANYFNLVKQLDPIYYIYDGQRNSPATVNSGNTVFTTTFDSGIVTANAGAPLSLIGNGNAWQTNSAAADNNKQITLSGIDGINALKTMHKTRTWAYEFWLKPTEYGVGSSANAFFLQNGYMYISLIPPTSNVWPNGSGNATLRMEFANSTSVFSNFTIPKSAVSINNWHHLVINATETISQQQQIQVWIDGILIGTNTFTFTPNATQVDNTLSSTVIYGNTMTTWFDEIAIYDSPLNNTEIIQHHQFIVEQSPNRTVFVDQFDADAIFPDSTVLVVDNNNFPATPITASQLFVEPIIDAQKYIDIASDPITASTEFINPSFYGTPDYRQDASPMIASAEKGNNSFALDGTYYSYINTNIAPFRYVTLDGPNVYTDYGTDTDYSVVPTSIGGSVVNPGYGINNKSVLTPSQSYTNSGIIMKESEWDDTWGTGQATYHSAFWMQSTPQDTSNNGLKVLWNLNGYKDNQHVILYQYQNKLHLQFNNGSGTHINSPTASNYNLFDGNRHFILINFNHTNVNNNVVNLYVDSILVSTVNLGTYTGTTTNSATSLPANDETYNYPRLCAGGLITPFNVTALPVEPSNISILVDELYWAQTGANQTLVTNIYNAMPIRTNKVWAADFFIASNANLPMPSINAGNTRIAAALTANAQLVTPTIIADYEKIIYETPATASGLLVMPVVTADNVTNQIISATPMIASAFINPAVVIITIPAGIMSATVKFLTEQPYMDPYNLLIMQQGLISSVTFGFWSSYNAGDID
jgi:hypothetical protein